MKFFLSGDPHWVTLSSQIPEKHFRATTAEAQEVIGIVPFQVVGPVKRHFLDKDLRNDLHGYIKPDATEFLPEPFKGPVKVEQGAVSIEADRFDLFFCSARSRNLVDGIA
jgi:hypothetical protein